jgi:uncharacterized protein (DUF305 family)
MHLTIRTGVGRSRQAAVLIALTIVAAIVPVSGCSRAPADDSAEAGFARDMATHHDQAVEMAFILRDATTDSRLRALTYDIIVTQTAQRGMFMGWLQQWGLPQASSGPRMAWMSTHEHGTGLSAPAGAAVEVLMPGMASTQEMDRLRTASSREAEVLFLQLMIRHHEGGVHMARALIERSANEPVVEIARSIDATQRGEIAEMKELLAERGAQPLPSMLE